MSVQNLIDRYASTLASGYTSGGASISVASATGLPSGACSFLAIVKAEGANTEEVFLVTNVSGTTLTVTGAQLGTSASNHASGATIIAGIWAYAVMKQSTPVLLEEHTASSSAELDFTSWQSSDFDTYQIEIVQLVPATNGANINMQFSTNGGSTYDTGSNYAYVGARQSIGGTANNIGSNATTAFGLDVGAGPTNTAARGGMIATIMLYMSGSGSVRPRLHWQGGNDDGTTNLVVFFIAQGEYLSVTAVNAFRVLASSGNLSSGTIRVYGIPK